MKFGKEFVDQMVVEWEEAYLDYNSLKFLLKVIKLSANESTRRKTILYNRVFSDITERNTVDNNENSVGSSNSGDSIMYDAEEGDLDDEVIVVCRTTPRGTEERYETMFLMSTDEGGDYEVMFFKKLDDEFNKVNTFYRKKMAEVMEEAVFLNKQLDALDAFRIKVGNHPHHSPHRPSHAADEGSSSPARSTTVQSPEEILQCVRINIPVETPYSTIKSILKIDKEKELKFSKENLKKVEAQLKHVFIEYHHKLRHLRKYSFLNRVAIEKILKKYDKICSRSASKPYLSVVDESDIGSHYEVLRMMERVEATFIRHFSNSNRSRGMKMLRHKEKKEKHSTTFSLGVFTGCALALLVTLSLIFRLRNIVEKKGFDQYMESMFPLYSVFGFIVLHMVMFSGNIYFWRRYRVNYSFIFGFKKGTEIGYRDVMFLSAGLATLALATVVANLDMELDEETQDYKTLTELLPLGLIALIVLVIVCPFNVLYRSSRFYLVRIIFRGICAPLYRGKLIDYFWADQLTSEIQALRSLEFYICYYGWGDFEKRRHNCLDSDIYRAFNYIVGIIPYWTRLVQGIRHSHDVRDMTQAWNSLKHFFTIVAVLTRTAYVFRRGDVWWVLALISSILATAYCIYWDLVVDWGLLQRKSKNHWLRDRLTIPHKSVYYICIVVNVVLRFAWLQTVVDIQISGLHRESVIAIFASLEIIRRGMWNYFRVEIEHVNNVTKYRASKSVPHPFDYAENEVDMQEATRSNQSAMKSFSFLQFLK